MSLVPGIGALGASLAGYLESSWAFLAQASAETGAAADMVAPPGGIRLEHYLVVSALVFVVGVLVIVIRRNAIAVLMGIELLLNAAALNFVAFGKFVARDPVEGQVVTVFLIVLAAAEAALALAIILNIFNNTNSIEVAEVDSLKG